eukprot:sb/3467119/
MDRTTLVFIENLALADILISVLYYFPMMVTVLTGKWIFGDIMCWFSGFFSSHIPFIAEIQVIMAISCYRLWMLRRTPGQRGVVKVIHIKVLVSLIWAVSSIPVLYWIGQGCGQFYSKKIMMCWTDNHLPTSPTYLSTKIFTAIFIAIPMIIVFLANIKILCIIVTHSLKIGRSLMPHIRTVITVNLICWAFLFSYTPIFIHIILKSTQTEVPPWFALFQVYAKSIHVVLNPFIYVATNRRFRRYVGNHINRHTYMQPGDSGEDGVDGGGAAKKVSSAVPGGGGGVVATLVPNGGVARGIVYHPCADTTI